ncbi:hypothetical protein HDU98_012002 [Podochytrium sp. JEL0797]|nr:hypothetical protein HDU98_012002 [Podochytrium sp. JEL0797]
MPRFPKLSKRRFWCATIGVTFAVVIIVSGLFATAWMGVSKTVDRGTNAQAVSDPPVNQTGAPFLAVLISLSSIDVVGQTIKFTYNFEAEGSLANPKPTQRLFSESSHPLTLTIVSQKLKFSATDALATQSIPSFLYGDYNLYPFDTFSTILSLNGQYGVNQTAAIPLQLFLSGRLNGFEATYEFADQSSGSNSTDLLVAVTITRSLTVITFSIMIATCMWVLTVCACGLCVCVCVLDMKLELLYIAMMLTLLFAMPTVRNAMPSAPPSGCIIDQLVLVWVMMLLAVCASSLFCKLLSDKFLNHNPLAAPREEEKMMEDVKRGRTPNKVSEEEFSREEVVGIAEDLRRGRSYGGFGTRHKSK